MAPVLIGLMTLAVLLAIALTGPAILRRAAGALVHVPRVATALLLGSVLAWVAAVLALGPLLAWFIAGPAALPGRAGEVCQRCVAAANPFAGPVVDSALPSLALIGPPLLVAAVLAAGGLLRTCRGVRATKTVWSALQGQAHRTELHGHRVHLVPDLAPAVFALPARRGGVIVSTAALELLSDDELRGVLEHERAHLRQRHHLVLAVLAALAGPMRKVPFIAAAIDAIPHYLEIAADNAARRHASTPALAGALLKLGNPALPRTVPAEFAGALHAAGPRRIAHLVNPAPASGSRWTVGVLTAYAGVMAVAGMAVVGPYLGAIAVGC